MIFDENDYLFRTRFYGHIFISNIHLDFCIRLTGAFRLYDVDDDGFITREEMYDIVDAIYQMVVSTELKAETTALLQKIKKKKTEGEKALYTSWQNEIKRFIAFFISSISCSSCYSYSQW